MALSCNKCGKKPRKVSQSGKTLTMCDECQRADWRKQKANTHGYGQKKNTVRTSNGASSKVRRCKSCKTTKPTSKFNRWGSNNYRTTCKACELEKQPKEPQQLSLIPTKATGNHILFIDGNNFVLAQIISQSPEVHNQKLVMQFYREQGYQIEKVVESEVLTCL